jgi:hypothetical protein
MSKRLNLLLSMHEENWALTRGFLQVVKIDHIKGEAVFTKSNSVNIQIYPLAIFPNKESAETAQKTILDRQAMVAEAVAQELEDQAWGFM